MMNQNKFDRHFWSFISILTKPCALCKRKSMSSSLFGSGRPSTMPSLDVMTKSPTCKTTVPDSPSAKIAGTASGFQCLWCSRCYHRRCWEQIMKHEENNKCDYGILR